MSKVRDLILELAGGNPGALTVLCEGYERIGDRFLEDIKKNPEVRGLQIWTLYANSNCRIHSFKNCMGVYVDGVRAEARRKELAEMDLKNWEKPSSKCEVTGLDCGTSCMACFSESIVVHPGVDE